MPVRTCKDWSTLLPVTVAKTASLITWIAPMLVSVAVSLAPRTCEPADENSRVLFRELAILGIITD